MSLQPLEREYSITVYNVCNYMAMTGEGRDICAHATLRNEKNTFCSSWDPEYFVDMDLISPPKADAQSFTLGHKQDKERKFSQQAPKYYGKVYIKMCLKIQYIKMRD